MRCKQGYLKEGDMDKALIRLFTARMKLGMFDPPAMVPYTKIDESELNSRGASRAGAEAGERVHGAAEERWRAAAEDLGHQDRGGRPAGRRRPRCCWATTTASRRTRFRFWKGLKKEFAERQITYT